MENKSTTIKISKKTKERIEGLREYKRETYEEILQRMPEILNLCKISPERAQARLRSIDRKQRSTRK